jgi:hypothetical protein
MTLWSSHHHAAPGKTPNAAPRAKAQGQIMAIDLSILESRAANIGEASPEYYTAWPRTYALNQLINREWIPADLEYLLEGVDDEHRDMVLHDYSGQLFAIAVVTAHDCA